MRRLVAGLGNPGAAYARTRHNIGFLVLDTLASRHALRFGRSRLPAEIANGVIAGQQVVLARPQTYMNESGRAVAGLTRYYGVAPADVLVVFDDLDLPFGHLRLRGEGSAGGHRGLQSIIDHLGQATVPRLRIGIGRPPADQPAERFVLSGFSADERAQLPAILATAADSVEVWLADGLSVAMNRYNGWAPPAPPA